MQIVKAKAKRMSPKGLFKKSLWGLTAATMLAGVANHARAGGPEFMEDTESGAAISGREAIPEATEDKGGILSTAKNAFQYVNEHKMMIGALLVATIGTIVLVKFSADHNFDSGEMMEAAGAGINSFFGGVADFGQSALQEATRFGQSVKATMGGYDAEIEGLMQKINEEASKLKVSLPQNPFLAVWGHLTGKTAEKLNQTMSNLKGSQERILELQGIQPLSFFPSFSKFFGQKGSA